MDVLIVRLRSSGFGCYLFGVYFGCLMFADAILLLAHTVSAMRHMLKICDLFAVDYDVKFNSSKLCGRPTICPRHCKLTFDLLTLKVVSESHVTRATSVSIFSLPRPLCSRLRPNVRDRQTDRRQTCIIV